MENFCVKLRGNNFQLKFLIREKILTILKNIYNKFLPLVEHFICSRKLFSYIWNHFLKTNTFIAKNKKKNLF